MCVLEMAETIRKKKGRRMKERENKEKQTPNFTFNVYTAHIFHSTSSNEERGESRRKNEILRGASARTKVKKREKTARKYYK